MTNDYLNIKSTLFAMCVALAKEIKDKYPQIDLTVTEFDAFTSEKAMQEMPDAIGVFNWSYSDDGTTINISTMLGVSVKNSTVLNDLHLAFSHITSRLQPATAIDYYVTGDTPEVKPNYIQVLTPIQIMPVETGQYRACRFINLTLITVGNRENTSNNFNWSLV